MKNYSIGTRYISLLLLVAFFFSFVPSLGLEAHAVKTGDFIYKSAEDDGVTMLNNGNSVSLPIKINNFVNDGLLFEYLGARSSLHPDSYKWESSKNDEKSFVQLYPYYLISQKNRTHNFADKDGFSSQINVDQSVPKSITSSAMISWQYYDDNGSSDAHSHQSGDMPFVRLMPHASEAQKKENYRPFAKLTTFNQAQLLRNVRYAVVVYRAPSDESWYDFDDFFLTLDDASGPKSARVKCVTGENGKNWQFAVIDLMAGGVSGSTKVNSVYLRTFLTTRHLSLLWYDPEIVEGMSNDDQQLDHLIYSDYYQSVASFRSNVGDAANIYAAIKSGGSGVSHADVDVGAFVMEALGQRWFEDLGSDNYNMTGYFSTGANGGRWTYYQKRTEGHNTLVINPDKSAGQVIGSQRQIEQYKSGVDGGYALVNMLDAYDTYVPSGTAITPSGTKTNCVALSATDLKASAAKLGSAFESDNYRSKNGGYPILNISTYHMINVPMLTADSAGAYCIYTADELRALAYMVNVQGETFDGKTIKLCADIDLESIEWIPIGGNWSTSTDTSFVFKGDFDGCGHVISNLSITSGNYRVGLFGIVNGGSIKNLGIASGMVIGADKVGGLAGNISGGTVISNCYNKANVSTAFTGTGVSVGGIVGFFSGDAANSVVRNCYSNGEGINAIIGKVSENAATVTMENCHGLTNVR